MSDNKLFPKKTDKEDKPEVQGKTTQPGEAERFRDQGKASLEADLAGFKKRFSRAAKYASRVDRMLSQVQNVVNELTVESASFLSDTRGYNEDVLTARATRGDAHALSILRDHLERARAVMRQVESVNSTIRSHVQSGQSVVDALREEVSEDDV